MIHYHGTPITPRRELERLSGKHFCISYADPRDANWAITNSQSIMWDNGAFSAYTRGKLFDKNGYISWLDNKLYGANWAVIPDVIDGTVEDQREYMSGWPYPKHLSAPVWHMHLPFDWLQELIDNYPRFCFGSSGEYWKVGTKDWSKRADEAWNIISKSNARPWVHMMRGLSLSKERWPFASADSTNVARNHKNRNNKKCPKAMCERIDSVQTPLVFTLTL
tara:strand:+ start:523 stop:1185 length:663 start_codon:yes stop_codon:yes gene_type:complete